MLRFAITGLVYTKGDVINSLAPKSETSQTQSIGQGTLRIAQSVVDLDALTVTTPQGRSTISYKSAMVLGVLHLHAGQPVTRRHLLETVWSNSIPTDEVLSHAITELRRALNDSPRKAAVIQTIPRVGYRLRREALSPGLTEHDSQSLAPKGRWRLISSLAAAATLAGLFWAASPAGMSSREVPVGSVQGATALTFEYGVERGPVLAPNGATLAYVAQSPKSTQTDLFVRAVKSGIVHQLTDTVQFEAVPDFSPDGRYLVFLRGGPRENDRQQIVLVDHETGQERVLTSTNVLTTLDFSPDGERILFSKMTRNAGIGLFEHHLETGQDQLLDYPRFDGEHDLDGRYAPDGSAIAFRRGVNPRSKIMLMSPGNRHNPGRHMVQSFGQKANLKTLLVPGDNVYGMRWQSDSQSLLLSLLRQGQTQLIDLNRQGQTQSLPFGVNATEPAPGQSNNQLVFVRWNARTELRRTTLSDASKSQTWFRSTGSDHEPSLSPDGQSLAFVSNRSGKPQVWLGDVRTGALNQLSDQLADQWTTVNWSDDGQTVRALKLLNGQWEQWRFHRTGSGTKTASLSTEVIAALQIGQQQVLSSTKNGGQIVLIDGNGRRRVLAERQALHLQSGPDNFVYFFDPQQLGLARISLDTGSVADLPLPVHWRNQQGWQVTQQEIAVMDFGRQKRPWLRRYRLSDLSLLDSTLLPGEAGDLRFDFSGNQVVYSALISLDSDIMLAQR